MLAIRQKLAPYSHAAGAHCLVPMSDWTVVAYPARWIFLGSKGGRFELRLSFAGGEKGWTVQQDFGRRSLFLFCAGYRVRVEAFSGGIRLSLLRGTLSIDGAPLEKGSPWERRCDLELCAPPEPLERLSLGSHRSQEWERAFIKKDWPTLLPLLFGLSQLAPAASCPPIGTLRLAEEGDWERFCQLAFGPTADPRLSDASHRGIIPDEPIPAAACPLAVYPAAYRLIRSLFCRQNERRLDFPAPPFLSGRLAHFRAPGVGTLHFEWTKGLPRRLWIAPEKSGDILLGFSPKIGSFRCGGKQRVSHGEPVCLTQGELLLIDRFEK